MPKKKLIPNPIQFFLLSVILWFVVDFGTAGGFRLFYYEKIWPAILFFYLGFPLIFSILIFRMKWDDRRLFFGMLVAIFIVEILFTRNPLLMTFPTLLWGIPLAVLIYTLLVFFPLWFLRNELTKHLLVIIVTCTVVLIVTLLTVFG